MGRNNQLDTIIKNGKESFFVEFKRDFCTNGKNIEIESKYIIIRESIAFLNNPFRGAKFLIFGVSDDGNIVGLKNSMPDDSVFQNLIKDYINPVPQIDIEKKEMDGKCILVLTISKYNNPHVYTAKKAFTNGNKTIRLGDSFIRVGTVVDQITANSLLNTLDSIQNSMFSLVDLDIDITLDTIEGLQEKINIFDKFLNKKVFMDDSCDINRNILFLEKFRAFLINSDSDYSGKVIIDGGINTICIAIFKLCNLLYEIEFYRDTISLINSNYTLIIDAYDNISNTDYSYFKQRVDDINNILSDYNKFQKYYGEKYFFKFTKIDFSNSIKQIYKYGEIKFRASDDIINLFIDPLYSSEEPIWVTFRELLQNSLDAIKFNESSKEINVSFVFSEISNNNLLKEIVFEDNGKGMDLETIQNIYFLVGKSKKSENGEGLIGKFGIGALANFLIGEECEITTKVKNQHFEYNFTITKKDLHAQSIAEKEIDKDQYDKSYTKINIKLQDKYKTKYHSKGEIESIFSFSDIVVFDKILITGKFFYNGKENIEEEESVSVLTPEILECFDKTSISKTDLYVLNRVKLLEFVSSNSENPSYKEIKIIADKIYKKPNIILYNNLITKFSVEKSPYTNIDESQIPFTIANGTISIDEGYTPPLDREQSKVSGTLLKEIVEKIYKIHVPILKEKIESLNKDGNYSNRYISKQKELEEELKYIKISKDYLYFNNTSLKLAIEDTNIDYRLYSNQPTDAYRLISEESVFDIRGIISKKSNLADIIEKHIDNILVISKSFLENHILNGGNASSKGFRTETLRYLLKQLGLSELISGTAKDTWEKIEESHTEILSAIDKQSKETITYIEPLGEDVLSKLDSAEIQNLNNLILVSNTRITPGYDLSFKNAWKQ